MNDRDRALGTIAARSEAAQARKARLNNNFRNAVKGTLACDGISEEQENTLLALLHVTETRCYTDAEYQVHVDVIKALAATPTRPADYFF